MNSVWGSSRSSTSSITVTEDTARSPGVKTTLVTPVYLSVRVALTSTTAYYCKKTCQCQLLYFSWRLVRFEVLHKYTTVAWLCLTSRGQRGEDRLRQQIRVKGQTASRETEMITEIFPPLSRRQRKNSSFDFLFFLLLFKTATSFPHWVLVILFPYIFSLWR